MSVLRYGSSVLLTISVVGCTAVVEQELIDNEMWEFVRAEDDPFEDFRESDSTCNPLGVMVEAGVLEVQTDVCDFVTVTQAAKVKARKGHLLDILAYHSALFSDPESTGYIAIQIGGSIVWEQSVSIPGDADVYANTMAVFPDINVGTPIYFHVHNHGANSWKLAHIRLIP